MTKAANTLDLRFLISRKNADGTRRWYWSPTADLLDMGWLRERLADDVADPVERELAAMRACHAKNQAVDAWRAAGARPLNAKVITRGKAPPAAGTVDDLFLRYKSSRFWNGVRNDGRPVLADKTRDEYEKCLARISAWIGDKPFRAITKQMANDYYEPLQRTAPAMANMLMRVARLVWNCADALYPQPLINGHPVKTYNPFESLKLIGLELTGQIWPREAIPVFEQAAADVGLWSIGTAIRVNHWIGQREGDVLNLPRTVVRNIALLQAKTRAGVDLPVGAVDEIMVAIAAELARQDARKVVSSKLLTCELTGGPWLADSFRHQFAAVRARAAIIRPTFEVDYIIRGRDPNAVDARIVSTAQLLFMWLRHTAVTRLAEAGASDLQISAVTGHSESTAREIRERYVIRTGTLALEAFKKRLEFERTMGATG